MPDIIQSSPGGPIAIIAHTHPSVTKGGAEIAAYALYEGLQKIGTEAIFIAACPSADRHKLQLASDREFIVTTDPLRYDHLYQLASSDVWRQLKAILVRNQVRLANFHHYLNFGVNSLRSLATETDLHTSWTDGDAAGTAAVPASHAGCLRHVLSGT
jgi:hypothetical protein